jgi:hypothetical protein
MTNPETNTPASSGGRPDPGGANSSPAARKNAAQAAVSECIGLWDKDTHMTRAEWRATCTRIQGRLDSVSVAVEKQTKQSKSKAAQRSDRENARE